MIPRCFFFKLKAILSNQCSQTSTKRLPVPLCQWKCKYNQLGAYLGFKNVCFIPFPSATALKCRHTSTPVCARVYLLFAQYQHIRAYSLQLHSNEKADEFWTALANGTNGVRTELEMADNLVGMTIMAIVYRERGLKHLKVSEG